MNRSSSSSLTLSRTITGFLHHKTAKGLSDRSVDSYRRILEHWVEYTGAIRLNQITPPIVSEYLLYLRTEYVPRRFGGVTHKLSPKTIRNIWISRSSFFSWAQTEFQIQNPMKDIPAPRFQKTPIEPFTQDEVLRMLKACTYSREADTADRRRFVMHRQTASRDQALILTLVNTGIRASEPCSLQVGNFDPKRGQLEMRHGVEGRRVERDSVKKISDAPMLHLLHTRGLGVPHLSQRLSLFFNDCNDCRRTCLEFHEIDLELRA